MGKRLGELLFQKMAWNLLPSASGRWSAAFRQGSAFPGFQYNRGCWPRCAPYCAKPESGNPPPNTEEHPECYTVFHQRREPGTIVFPPRLLPDSAFTGKQPSPAGSGPVRGFPSHRQHMPGGRSQGTFPYSSLLTILFTT